MSTKTDQTSLVNILSVFANYCDEPRWVEWREVNGQKIPYTPGTNKPARINDPYSWKAFKKCRGFQRGIVLYAQDDDGLCGADFDGCRNPETGVISEWAMEWVKLLDSYTEISPSKTGVKVFLRSMDIKPGHHVRRMPGSPMSIPDGDGEKNPQIEAYTKDRYFAVTGEHLTGTPLAIKDATKMWQRLLDFLSEGKSSGHVGIRNKEWAGRDEALFKYGCRLQREGYSDDEIITMMTAENHSESKLHERFATEGPLDDRVLQTKFRQVLERYQKGDRGPNNELEKMNAKYTVLGMEGSKFRIMSWKSTMSHGITRTEPVLQTRQDFLDGCIHPMIVYTTEKNGKNVEIRVPRGKWWLNNPGRLQYDGLCFEPMKGPEIGDYLNLWRGFGVEKKEGDWLLLRRHVLEVLANGNEEYAKYVIKWAAWAVQNPDKPAGVALVFKGEERSGKGTFCRALIRLFGIHGVHILSQQHFTGRFNSLLHQCCLLFADEAFFAGDRRAEGVLKGMLTEPTIPIERKGLDVIQVRNNLHVVMSSNNEWVVPVSRDSWRFAIFEVSNAYVHDKEYFSALYDQLDGGGYGGLLNDLLGMELGDWRPDDDIPQTEALEHQKQLSDEGANWGELIEEMIDTAYVKVDSDWQGGIKILCSQMRLIVTSDEMRWNWKTNQVFGTTVRDLGFRRAKLMAGKGSHKWFYAKGEDPYKVITIVRDKDGVFANFELNDY